MATLTTNDGVELHYDVAGTGPPLVLVHGWNQTAALFERQVAGLSDRFQVITFDLRGHGESERPDHGYRIARYAMDLHTVIDKVAGQPAHVLGHSMGCCVLWSYFDLFAGDGIKKAVFVDMMTHPIANPAFTEQQVADYGSILSPEAFFGVFNGLTAGAAAQVVPGLIDGMVTENISTEDKAWLLAENARMPGPLSAREFFTDILADWRDVPPRINRPSLYIAGEGSFIPISATRWAAEQTPGAQFESIPAGEGGNHFMFIENPDRFNRLVSEFLTTT